MRGLRGAGAGSRPLARRLELGPGRRVPAPETGDRFDGGRGDEIVDVGGGSQDVGRGAGAAGGHCDDKARQRSGVSEGMRGRVERRRVVSGQRHAMVEASRAALARTAIPSPPDAFSLHRRRGSRALSPLTT